MNSKELVIQVTLFLKSLAYESEFIVTAILDGDIRPHIKRDAFARRYDRTMAKVDRFIVG